MNWISISCGVAATLLLAYFIMYVFIWGKPGDK